MPSSTSIGNRTYRKNLEIIEFEIRPFCKHCNRTLAIFKRSHPHPVVGIPENYWVIETYYRCGHEGCPGGEEQPIKPENGFVAPDCDFDFDVMARVVELRWRYHRTYDEIVADMMEQHNISICRASVENIVDLYEIGCSEKYGPIYIKKIKEFGGIILTIDGMKPLKGTKGLYVVYDYNTGLPLGARKLKNEKNETIAEFLEEIKRKVEEELGVEIIGIVSDALPCQRIAIEKVFPGVPHCLCHYHFYEYVLKEPGSVDNHLLTTIRSVLRNIKEIKDLNQETMVPTFKGPREAFIRQVLEALHALSNWKKRPKDSCFSGLELYKRLHDILDLLTEALQEAKRGVFGVEGNDAITNLRDGVKVIIDDNKEDASELGRITEHLKVLKEVLTDLETSKSEGLKELQVFRTRLRKFRLTSRCGPLERHFIEALMKYVKTKGELLFNYKDVEGAPRTNNAHELHYKQLKHLLRKVIGFTAANSYLLAHGERIVFVDPRESYEGILEIFKGMDHARARAVIASERKSRDSLCFVMHDVERWEILMSDLRAKLEILRKSI